VLIKWSREGVTGRTQTETSVQGKGKKRSNGQQGRKGGGMQVQAGAPRLRQRARPLKGSERVDRFFS